MDMEKPLVFGIYYIRNAVKGHSAMVFLKADTFHTCNVCFSHPWMVFNFFGDQMPSMEGASISILPSEAYL